MQKFWSVGFALTVTTCLACKVMESRARADAPPPLTYVSLEAKALETLYTLDLSAQQLKALQQLAKGAADQRDRQAGTGPAELRAALIAFGTAIVRGDDDDQIEELQDDAAEQWEGDDVDLDDAVALTATARKRAPDVLKLLTPSQVAAYVSDSAEDISDPLEDMFNALDETRTTEEDGFVELRDQTADDVALALAGLDADKDAKISAKVTAWLNRARALSESEFTAKRADLQQEAKTLVGEVDALQVVRHYLERDMAELLANPRLTAAIAERLQSAKD